MDRNFPSTKLFDQNETDQAVSGSLALGIKKPASKTIGGKIMTKNICGVKYLFYEFELCEFIFYYIIEKMPKSQFRLKRSFFQPGQGQFIPKCFWIFYPLDIFSIQTFLAAKLSPGPVTNSQIPPMNKPAQINMQHSGTAGALLDAE